MDSNPETTLFLHLDPQKQQRILDAAIGEFAEKGFHSASMNAVVERAEISKGALFKYFGSKGGLFSYIYRMTLHQIKRILRRVRDDSQAENFFVRLEKVMIAGIDFMHNYPRLAQIYYHIIYTGDSPFQKDMLQELHAASIGYIEKLVRTGLERGELRQRLDPKIAAFTLETILDRFLQAHHVEFLDKRLNLYQASPEQSRRWVKEIMDTVRLGMANRSKNEEAE